MLALTQRSRQFALRIIRLVQSFPSDETSRVIGKQLLRSGTSVGANYRAAERAKSDAHFLSKLGDVEEECDECIYWMELALEAGLIKPARLKDLLAEANELLAITVASINTTKKRINKN